MKFVILTGMSGAGKSTALKMMEDIGFYCVDNLPIPLLEKFVELSDLQQNAELQKVAVGIDIRSGQALEELRSVLDRIKANGGAYDILFLDAEDSVLVKRYKETRRSHPLAGSERVDKGIAKESTRGTIVLLAVNVFQIMASGVVIPTAYLPEIFGKIGAFFPLAFWDSYYLKLLFFGIKGQETEQLLLMFCVFFAASVLWAKAAGHFGKVGWERHKKGGSLTVGGFGKSVFFNWYFLQLKAWLKRGTSLLLLVSMLFVVWFAGQISMPQSDNVTVGIVSTEGAHGKEVLEHLTQRESLFSFVMYDSKEALKEDVIAGKLECGFYFSSNFEKKFEHQKLKNSVSYLCTPLTTKGEVARETFYAALFEVYGAQMLGARTEQLFGDEANAACDVLLANNEKYLKGSEVFQVNVEQTDAVETIEKEKQVFPLHGLVALFLFLILFVEYGRRFDAGSGKPYLALPAPLGEGFQMMGLLAAGTVPAVTGLVLLLCSGESRGLLWEISGMILLLAVCIVWIWIVGKWIHNLTSFTSHMFFLVLINLVFCPVFVDIAAYIPALKFVRYLFPVGIYLGFISL